MKSHSKQKNTGFQKEIEKQYSRAKPFLKWAGGKGQLLKTFADFYPDVLKVNRIKNYYEPFVGGGAVFFDIVQKYQIESAFLFDVNEELILAYRVVQQDVSKLIEQLEVFKKKYETLDEKQQSDYYYEVRNDFNNARYSINYQKYSGEWIKRAAQIIFLNKTCFNGLFRFNSNGGFNVPAGRYKNPKILDEQNLINVSELLTIAEIRKADFRELAGNVKPASFVYFDPPYRPLNKTSNFTSYSKTTFGDEEQKELAALFTDLDKEKTMLMMSNSDPQNFDPNDRFFDEIYKQYHIYRVSARRSINSDASKRDAVKEIIVTNYAVKQWILGKFHP